MKDKERILAAVDAGEAHGLCFYDSGSTKHRLMSLLSAAKQGNQRGVLVLDTDKLVIDLEFVLGELYG